MLDDILYKKRGSVGDENLTPLINVVFLLLIFFMLAGQIQGLAKIDITPPKTQNAEKENIQELHIMMNSSGALSVNGRPVDNQQLNEIAAQWQAQGKMNLVLAVDRKANAKQLSELLQRLTGYGIETVKLMATSS